MSWRTPVFCFHFWMLGVVGTPEKSSLDSLDVKKSDKKDEGSTSRECG